MMEMCDSEICNCAKQEMESLVDCYSPVCLIQTVHILMKTHHVEEIHTFIPKQAISSPLLDLYIDIEIHFELMPISLS